MDWNQLPKLKAILESYSRIEDTSQTLFHATTKSAARKILQQGFSTEHCGAIHGEMENRPAEKTIYFSKFPTGSNLNTNLFDMNEEVMVLEVDPGYFKLDCIYPDDSFYVGIGQEELFSDVDDILDEFDIPEEEAEYLYEQLWEMCNDNAHLYKPFALWFLHRDGEISVSHNIPKEAIIRVEKHPESPKVKLDAGLAI